MADLCTVRQSDGTLIATYADLPTAEAAMRGTSQVQFDAWGGLIFDCAPGAHGTCAGDGANIRDLSSVVEFSSVLWTADTSESNRIQVRSTVYDSDVTNRPTITVSGCNYSAGIYLRMPHVDISGFRFVVDTAAAATGRSYGIAVSAYHSNGNVIDRNVFNCTFRAGHSAAVRIGGLYSGIAAPISPQAFTCRGNDVYWRTVDGAGDPATVDFSYSLIYQGASLTSQNTTFTSEHNTLYGDFSASPGGFLIQSVAATSQMTVNAKNDVAVQETIGDRGQAWWVNASGGTLTHNAANCASNDNSLTAAIAGSGSLTQNVSGEVSNSGLANGFASATDHNLLSSSLLIGAGTNTASLTNDVVGEIYKDPPSIGAFEFVSSSGGTGTMGLEMDLLL